MLLLGISYSCHKPVMNMFLRPIIDDLNKISREGKDACNSIIPLYGHELRSCCQNTTWTHDPHPEFFS